MTRLTLVPGTWAWKPDDPTRWWQPTSAFVQNLMRAGYDLVSKDYPFVWTTDVNGILGDRTHNDWHAGGVNLFMYLVPPLCPDRRVPPSDCIVLTHSHGMQVALYAAAAGLKIDTLITVAGPIRGDMELVARKARPNIRHWRHIVGGSRDYMQLLGGLFSGGSLMRKHPLADENIVVSASGHSDFLNDPAYHTRWIEEWLPKVSPREVAVVGVPSTEPEAAPSAPKETP